MTFLEARAAWAGARAHNAMRRRGLLIAVSGTTFVLTLLAQIFFVPREASRIALQAAPRPGEKVDTTLIALQAANAARALASADSALDLKRALAARAAVAAAAPIRVAAGSLTPAQIARRDSLGASVASITRLLARVQTSPLPSSYRALAEAPELRDEPRVRTLLDSLTDAEREREAFGLVGGVDPIYVALTARATAIGRSIQAIGDRRRGELQQELQALSGAASATTAAAPATPAAAAQGDSSVPGAGVRRDGGAALAASPPTPSVTRVDSTMEIFARTSAQRAVATSAERLAAARARNLAVDQRVETARKQANVEAPPLAMLMAAVMLSAVFGFGAALAVEVKRPRVADAREAERVARARVLAVVHDELVSPERVRRRADGQTPEHIDTAAESYRMLYLSLSATGSATPFVTVTGDEPAIVATVAANLAAIAAHDSRSTLLVDAAMGHASASILFGVGLRAGLGDVARDGLRITETIVPVQVGRDTTVDVVPAGPGAAVALDARSLDAVRLEIARLSRRYDFTVLTEAVERAERGGQSLLVSPDVIVCARAGHTPLSGVAREIVRLRNAGALVRGIVVWSADVPTLATLAEQRADAGRRPRVVAGSA